MKDNIPNHRNSSTRFELHQQLTFSIFINNAFPSSITQVDSSNLISCLKSSSIMGGWPLMPQVRCFFVIFTTRSFCFTLKVTFNGIRIWNKQTNYTIFKLWHVLFFLCSFLVQIIKYYL